MSETFTQPEMPAAFQPSQPFPSFAAQPPAPFTGGQGSTSTLPSQPAAAPWTGYLPAGGFQPGGPDNSPPPAEPQPPKRRRRWPYLLGTLLVLALLLGSFGVGHALVSTSAANSPGSTSTITVPPSAQDLQQTLIDVAKAVQPSVVEVTSQNGSSEAIGSGVILTKDGYIATNDHVVRGYNTYTVTLSNGTSEQAQVVGQDAQDDLAVLKIAASNLQPIVFADSSQLQVGEFSLAIGNPLGLEDSTTFGIVSALNRAASEQPSGPASELAGLIQTSAAINPGNSGGALVNLQGQLIGMPTLGATDGQSNAAANDIGFAIPSNRIKFVTDQLIKYGKLTSSGQGFLGIQGQDVTSQNAAANGLSTQQGVLVAGFSSDASGKNPAQQAGLQQGDVIIAVNGHPITNSDDLAEAILTQSPGTQVSLTIVRGSSQHTINVTLGERPVSQS